MERCFTLAGVSFSASYAVTFVELNEVVRFAAAILALATGVFWFISAYRKFRKGE